MRIIALEYQRLGYKKSILRNLPTAWSEVTPRQLTIIARNYLNECSDDLLLSALCNLSMSIIRKLDSYQKLQLAEQMHFLTDYKPFSHFIIKKIGILHAPLPSLKAMSFGQFIFVDSYYNDWLLSHKEEDMNKFISALYLPEGKSFRQENLPVYELIVERYPLDIRCAISLNYRLVKEFLIHAYPLIFQKSTKNKKEKSHSGWVSVLESVVSDDIINQDKYTDLSVHVVLRWITRKVKENAKR